MAVNETEPLQFSGPGVKECEKFVAAVIKHAYDQGKLRDDAWMADFAATCMVEDALSWWSGLDEEIQGSWRLLRQAMFSNYQPLFYGHSGEEAEQFVFSIRQRIRAAGKQKDNDWIITFVSDCFVGNALRWHVSLDAGIREDWKLLQVAILAQYPHDGEADPLLKMPIPAPIVPKTKSRGRIRIFKKNESAVSYLSRNSGNCGLSLTSSLTDALEVEYNPSATSPQVLLIPEGQTLNFSVLGARWNSVSGAVYAYLCAINPDTGGNSDAGGCSGRQMTSIWSVSSTPSEATQLLRVTAQNESGSLITRTKQGTGFIWLRTEPDPSDPDVDADLFFEPL